MPEKITLYGHPACPMVYPVRAMFDRAGVVYEYINIHEDNHARERVREINNGNESVPTLIFPDGSTMTEPPMNLLESRIRAMGYQIPLTTRLLAYAPRLLLVAIIIWAILRFLEIL